MTTFYEPNPGFRITRGEAQVIGAAILDSNVQYGKAHAVEKFENYCKSPRHAIHPIWNKKRQEFSAKAGRTAAAYLLRSVCILGPPRVVDGPPTRNEPVIVYKDSKNQGVSATPQYVRSHADVIETMEQEFKSTLRRAAEVFAAQAGEDRMLHAAKEVLNEFKP